MKIKIYASLVVLISLLGSGIALGQNNFRSVSNGDWTNSSVWEEETSPNVWESTGNIPDFNSGSITIQAFTTVGISTQITADQIFIQDDGFLEIGNGGHLIVNNGTEANDLEIELFFFGGLLHVNDGGVLENLGTIVAPDGTTFVNSGATYIHNQNGGNILLATWDPLSTCLIAGVTNSMPGQLNQNFGNFVWNCTGQTGNLSFGGNLTYVGGNLELINSNGRGLSLTNGETATINVLKDFVVSNSTRPALTNSGNATLNITENFNYSSTSTFILAGTGTGIIDVNKNFSASAGTIRFVQSTSGTPTARINIAGNLELSSTSFSTASNSGATASVVLDGTSLQTFTNSSSTISGKIDFTFKSNSIVNFGTSTLSGDGTFTLETGAEIRLASTSPSGAIADQIATTNKTFLAGSTITLNGSTKQYVGSGFPDAAINLEINNSAGIDLSSNFTIGSGANLILTNGNLNVGPNTLTLFGGIASEGSGSLNFDPTSSLMISKAGNFGNLPFQESEELQKLVINGANTVAAISNNLSVDSLIFANSSSLAIGTNKLTVSEYYDGSGGGLNVISGSVIEIGPDIGNDNPSIGALTFVSGNTLKKLILNRPDGSVDINSTVTVADTLELINGTINNGSGLLKMAEGATVIKQAGSTFLNPLSTSGTSYNVVYKGTLTTGKEINNVPSTNIKDLIVEAGAIVTLSNDITQPVTVNGNLENAGSLNTNGKILDFKGNLENNASFNATGSQIIFSGTTSITGSSVTTLSNVEITGTLVAPNNLALEVEGNWLVNGGTFDANGGTLEFVGSSAKTITSAGQPFHNLTFSGTGVVSLTDALDVNGSFTMASASSFSSGIFPVNIAGNVVLGGTYTGGDGIFTLDGTTSQSITSNGLSFSNLTIGGGGTKTIQDSLSVTRNLVITSTLNTGSFSRNIAVGGDWENNGTFVANSGTVFFNGTSTQQIIGSTVTEFNNITVTNIAGPPGLRISANTRLLGVLKLGENVRLDTDGGTNTTDGGVNFTLVSSASRTAAIAALPGGATIQGNVEVQRHIPAANVFRYIATPVQGATVAQWANDFTIAKNTLFWWDETVTTTGVGYRQYGTSTNPLAVGTGYAVNIPATSQAIIASTRGPVQHTNNTVNFGVTYTDTGNSDDDGWVLVGNPFPSAIDMESAGWTWTNINPTISIPDNTSSADGLQYATYNRETNVGLNNASQYVASGQAFWVKASAANPSLIATEEVKAGSETSTPFFRTAPPKDYLIIALNQGDKRDETAIFFHDEATEAYDKMLDSPKRLNGIFNLSTLTSDNTDVAFNLRPWFECATEVPMKISNINAGAYMLDFRELGSLTKDIDITLIDHYTNNNIKVEEGFEYNFVVNDEVASKDEARFSLLFSKEALITNLSIEGSTICESDSEATIAIENAQAGVSYQLYKGDVAISEILEGNNTALNIPVSADLLEMGTNELKVMAMQGNCQSVELPNAAIVTKTQRLEVNEIVGANICGSGSVSLQATGATANASYRWYASADAASPIEGATDATFNTPELSNTTTYYVSIVNENGCESLERKPVIAEVVPVAEVTNIEGNSSCSPAALQLKASGAPKGGGYRWYASADASEPIEGASEATFTTPVLSESATYWVSIVNRQGCESKERVSVTAEIVNPNQPKVIESNGQLVSNYLNGNQWYFNGTMIVGATGQSFTPSAPGNYTVQVMAGDCQLSSDAFEFTISGIEDKLSQLGISVYPNPAHKNLHISFGVKGANEVKYLMFNLSGAVLAQGVIKEKDSEGKLNQILDVQGLPEGLYHIVLNDGKNSYNLRFLKK